MEETLPDQTRVETATMEDLDELTEMVMSLMSDEADFEPSRDKQEHGLRLILDQPNRGRIFVVRNDFFIIGMVNILFTISTAEGGFVILMEDVVILPEHRGQGYGSNLVNFVIDFAKKKDFNRITLLTDKLSEESHQFFEKMGFEFSKMIPMRHYLRGE